MKKATQISLNLVALAISLNILCSVAAAETLSCKPIHSVPVTITKQGVYCLQKKLKMNSGDKVAIYIDTNNVTVDLNGYTIVNTTTSSNNLSVGIKAYNRAFLTVKNGVLRGFNVGVAFFGNYQAGVLQKSRGNTIEDLKIEKTRSAGIALNGDDHTVRNNSILYTGPYCWPGAGCSASGISVQGAENLQVLNNSIAHVRANGSGDAVAVRLWDVKDAFVLNNHISDTSFGIRFGGGATGKYRDNLTSYISGGAYIGGTNAGNNH